MFYRITSESTVGQLHKINGERNQDKAFIICGEDGFSISLADGAGSSKMAEQGAQAVSKAIAEYVFNNFAHLMDSSSSDLKKEIMKCVKKTLLSEKERSGNYFISDFSSTVLFAVSDGKKFIIGHLGDGVVLGVSKDNASVISFPENGRNSNETFLTTSIDAESHLRTYRGNLNMFEGFILVSDGLMPDLFSDGFVLNNKQNTLKLDQVLSRAAEACHNDDASYIKVDWRIDCYG